MASELFMKIGGFGNIMHDVIGANVEGVVFGVLLYIQI